MHESLSRWVPHQWSWGRLAKCWCLLGSRPHNSNRSTAGLLTRIRSPVHLVPNQASSAFVWSMPTLSLTSSQSLPELERLSSRTLVGRDDSCESLIYSSLSLWLQIHLPIHVAPSDVKSNDRARIMNVLTISISIWLSKLTPGFKNSFWAGFGQTDFNKCVRYSL